MSISRSRVASGRRLFATSASEPLGTRGIDWPHDLKPTRAYERRQRNKAVDAVRSVPGHHPASRQERPGPLRIVDTFLCDLHLRVERACVKNVSTGILPARRIKYRRHQEY